MTNAVASPYGFGILVHLPYVAALEQIKSALKEQGFGVLTEIDVRATLKQKLHLDSRPYTILGACNPPLAHQALQADPHIGLLLPCNVVVRESEDGTVVEAMDPEVALGIAKSPALDELAAEARRRLRRAIDAVGRSSDSAS